MKTIAIICAKDEDESVKSVAIKTKKYVDEVIVIDDGSKNPIELFDIGEKIFVFRNDINEGKGYSMKMGANLAKLHKADYFIFVDGDAQHDPKYIPDMLTLLNRNDFVKAYRCYEEMPWLKRFGNKGLSTIFQILFNMYVFDSQCGFKAYNKKSIKTLLNCKEDGYEIEIEQLINIKKDKVRIVQYPIFVNYLTPETRPAHGLHIGWTMLKKRIFG